MGYAKRESFRQFWKPSPVRAALLSARILSAQPSALVGAGGHRQHRHQQFLLREKAMGRADGLHGPRDARHRQRARHHGRWRRLRRCVVQRRMGGGGGACGDMRRSVVWYHTTLPEPPAFYPHVTFCRGAGWGRRRGAGTFTFTWTHAERVHQEFATTMAYCWKTCQVRCRSAGDVGVCTPRDPTCRSRSDSLSLSLSLARARLTWQSPAGELPVSASIRASRSDADVHTSCPRTLLPPTREWQSWLHLAPERSCTVLPSRTCA